MKFIKDFQEINVKDISIAGGKGANLGEMFKIGIPVPPGFVVLAEALRDLGKIIKPLTKFCFKYRIKI